MMKIRAIDYNFQTQNVVTTPLLPRLATFYNIKFSVVIKFFILSQLSFATAN